MKRPAHFGECKSKIISTVRTCPLTTSTSWSGSSRQNTKREIHVEELNFVMVEQSKVIRKQIERNEQLECIRYPTIRREYKKERNFM